jgi:membrane-associated phospholipid phosphatase
MRRFVDQAALIRLLPLACRRAPAPRRPAKNWLRRCAVLFACLCATSTASAWQAPLEPSNYEPLLTSQANPSLDGLQPPSSFAVAGGNSFASPPLVLARADRVLAPNEFARNVAAEPQPIRLPPPQFIAQADRSSARNTALDANPASASSGELVLPGENTPEGTLGLMTPPDGPRRRGFFARAFGPGVETGGEMLSDIRFDYRNFYSARSLIWLGAGIGVAAILANTSIDQHFSNWYQDDVRSARSDNIHNDIAWLGNGGLMLPIWLGTGFILTPLEEYSPTAHVIGTWGRNSTRAFLVGGPMLLALQYGLGAHRPSADINSYWHPFRDSHGASGDAWIGAISFLTAAKMTDSKLIKAGMWALALFPAWGRIDVDQHYLSQVTLGVWLAALSVEAVDITDRSTNMFIIPSAGPGTFGATFGIKW